MTKYVSPAQRKANKIENGIPVHFLDSTVRRHRAKMLRYQRQTGETI